MNSTGFVVGYTLEPMRLHVCLFSLLPFTMAYAADLPARPTSGPETRALVAATRPDPPSVGREPIVLEDHAAGEPSVRIEVKPHEGVWTFLGWDTEGGDRMKHNLLRAPLEVRAVRNGQSLSLKGTAERRGEREVVFQLAADDQKVTWLVRLRAGGLSMHFEGAGDAVSGLDRLELVFPFDITTAATCPITGEWTRDGKLRLPMLLHAPDIGTMRVDSPQQQGVLGRWEGSRVKRQATLTLELPIPAAGRSCALEFQPWQIPRPQVAASADEWIAARRGWLNLYQLSTAQLPEGGRGATPAGLWANNVISDPVCNTTFFLGEHVLLVPELAPGIKAADILRRTIEYWLDHPADEQTGRLKYVVNEQSMGSSTPVMADSNPSMLITAWCYIEASGDTAWLRERLARLEWVAGYMERRDIDGDGLIESPQTGNRGTHAFGDTAWDTYSSGHKNAYVNALAHRALRCLADLEKRAGRSEQAAYYATWADKLKLVFRKTFFNPETGWLGWWRSADGALHDVWSDVPTSLAVMYGLIPPNEGCEMLDRYWVALEKAGFKRFDLGIPLNVRPVHRDDQFRDLGGKKEDGSDTFGKYLNGGCCVSNTCFWLRASYLTGRSERADTVLRAMLDRQRRGVFPNGGGFQNGVIDRWGQGAEFLTWDGQPCGYEGHLVYSWTWLQALFMRDASVRERLNKS